MAEVDCGRCKGVGLLTVEDIAIPCVECAGSGKVAAREVVASVRCKEDFTRECAIDGYCGTCPQRI